MDMTGYVEGGSSSSSHIFATLHDVKYHDLAGDVQKGRPPFTTENNIKGMALVTRNDKQTLWFALRGWQILAAVPLFVYVAAMAGLFLSPLGPENSVHRFGVAVAVAFVAILAATIPCTAYAATASSNQQD
jgi:hypothetical protein